MPAMDDIEFDGVMTRARARELQEGLTAMVRCFKGLRDWTPRLPRRVTLVTCEGPALTRHDARRTEQGLAERVATNTRQGCDARRANPHRI